MKILKKILGVIAVLTVLMCILILLCALNPNITKKLSGLVSGDRSPQRTEEAQEAESEEVIGFPDEEPEYAEPVEAEEPEEEQPQETSVDGERFRYRIDGQGYKRVERI